MRQSKFEAKQILNLRFNDLRLKTIEHDVGNSEFPVYKCQMNNSEKFPKPKDSGTRAKDVLEIVHTDVLIVTGMELASQAVLVTRERAIEKVKQFVAHLAKLGTSGRVHFEQDEAEICKTRLRTRVFSTFYTCLKR